MAKRFNVGGPEGFQFQTPSIAIKRPNMPTPGGYRPSSARIFFAEKIWLPPASLAMAANFGGVKIGRHR